MKQTKKCMECHSKLESKSKLMKVESCEEAIKLFMKLFKKIKSRLESMFNNKLYEFTRTERLHSFDVSADGKLIVLISNRTIFTLPRSKHLHYTALNYFNPLRYLYEEEDEFDDRILVKNIPVYLQNSFQIKDQIEEAFIEEVKKLEINLIDKSRIQQIFCYICDNIHPNGLIKVYEIEIIYFINNVLELLNENNKNIKNNTNNTNNTNKVHSALKLCFYFINNIIANIERMQSLAAFFIPNLLLKTEHFDEYFLRNAFSLFRKWPERLSKVCLFNSCLRHQEIKEYLISFLLKILEELELKIELETHKTRHSHSIDRIDIEKIENDVVRLLSGESYKEHCERELLARESVQGIDALLEISEKEEKAMYYTLEELVGKQALIKKAIVDVRR